MVVYYLPSTMSSARLIHDLAVEFKRLGHEPVVAAPDENIKGDCEIACEDGIKVLRVRTGKIRTAPRVIRGINEARLSETVWRKGRRFFEDNPCDLVIYYSPTIFWGALVKRLKKHYSCPSYLILRDIFPQWAVDAGILRKGLAYRYFKYKERENYEAADIIGVQSPANLQYFKANGHDSKYGLEVLFNWAAAEQTAPPAGSHRKRLRLQGKVVFFYGGNIGVAQDMDNIIRLARRLRDEKTAYFLIVGSGSEAERLRAKIRSIGLSNISIQDAVGQDQYFSMLSEFDVGLISLDRGLKTQNFPGKMLGYMSQSMPMLASINPGNDLKEIIESSNAGLVCLNGEDEKFEDNARRLLEDVNLRTRMGVNSRALLDEMFSVKRAAGQILSHFN